jgi:DNA-binding XRE family transcriptional regulator
VKPATKNKKIKPLPVKVARKLSPRNRGSQAASTDEGRLQLLFATNVKLIRKARELSQEALADLADLDRTYISSTERNRRNVTVGSIQRIADALRVDVRVLFDSQLTEQSALALIQAQGTQRARGA